MRFERDGFAMNVTLPLGPSSTHAILGRHTGEPIMTKTTLGAPKPRSEGLHDLSADIRALAVSSTSQQARDAYEEVARGYDERAVEVEQQEAQHTGKGG